MTDASHILDLSPVIPVVTIIDPGDAVPIARALVAGGIEVIEVTLRTPSALEAVQRITREVPEITAGAGTVLTTGQAAQAVAAGAQFLVSPGATPSLLQYLSGVESPVLPGVATVSEAMRVLDLGLSAMKFFPAGPAGGPPHLAAISAPLPHARFCPTGGITVQNAVDYLRLPNVTCVGGSWLTPQDAIENKEWHRITQLARKACELGK